MLVSRRVYHLSACYTPQQIDKRNVWWSAPLSMDTFFHKRSSLIGIQGTCFCGDIENGDRKMYHDSSICLFQDTAIKLDIVHQLTCFVPCHLWLSKCIVFDLPGSQVGCKKNNTLYLKHKKIDVWHVIFFVGGHVRSVSMDLCRCSLGTTIHQAPRTGSWWHRVTLSCCELRVSVFWCFPISGGNQKKSENTNHQALP